MGKSTIQNNTKNLVPAVYYDIFVMRVQGYDMKEIAEKTGYSHVRIRTLFARGGVLHQFYRDWVENRKAGKVEEAMDLMFEHLPDVVKANIGHAMTTTQGAPAARKLIFDGTLGDLVKRAEAKPVGAEHATVADLIKSAYDDDETENTSPEDQGSLGGESTQLPQG